MLDAKSIKDIYLKGLEKLQGEPRDYLGASQLGKKCIRELYYSSKNSGCVTIKPNILSLFKTGDMLEAQVVYELANAGFKVDAVTSLANHISTDIPTLNDDTLGFSIMGGKIKGHADGRIYINNEWHLLEIKTCNDRLYKALDFNGVYIQYPQYVVQMQLYMHFLEFEKCLFVAKNKNNSDTYFEIVCYDEKIAKNSMKRANYVLEKKSVPEKKHINVLTNDLVDFDSQHCYYCDYKDLCKNDG